VEKLFGKVTALAAVFGVEPSYLLDRGEPVLDGELIETLRDEAIREATREISQLPEWEKRLVLGIVRQFGSQDDASTRQDPGDSVDREAADR
jgi:hypothetical protein